ncbi:response regulator [Pseudonocardia alni]|uniref:response regulator n=1 Tax=Pseudonocardia alni TaxID=33907 RepID=UPI0027A5831D|nr:response regulator transcription factor [Pseudonocardia alni]
MTVTVVVADDDPLVRTGVGMLLRSAPDLAVVGEAADGAAAVELVRRDRPDVVVMDLRMPGTDGTAATRAITADRADDPDLLTRVLVLTTFHDDDAVYGALRAGASGYLLKHAAPADLVPAVRRVAAGDAWLDPAVASRVIAALVATDPDRDDPPQLLARLTAREREVLTLMAHGRSNDEIAAGLVLSGATVRTHVNRILMKTGTGNRTNAVILAFRSGLVDPRR